MKVPSRSDHSNPSISTIFDPRIPQISTFSKISKPKIPEFKILLMEMLGKRAGTCQLSHFVATLNPGAFCVINNNFIWSVYWRNSTGTQFFVVAFWSHAFWQICLDMKRFWCFFTFLCRENKQKHLWEHPVVHWRLQHLTQNSKCSYLKFRTWNFENVAILKDSWLENGGYGWDRVVGSR